MDAAAVRENVLADLRRGLSRPAEDLVIAGLVMAPFALTAGVTLGWLTWAPSFVLILFTLAVQAVATVWNAGFLARPAA